jgi:hypothetical protein
MVDTLPMEKNALMKFVENILEQLDTFNIHQNVKRICLSKKLQHFGCSSWENNIFLLINNALSHANILKNLTAKGFCDGNKR